MIEINKRYAFSIDLKPQEVILYASSKDEACRKFTELTAPLWRICSGMKVRCVGETNKHDPHVENLLKEYFTCIKYPELFDSYEFSEMEKIRLELMDRNVLKPSGNSSIDCIKKGA